MMDDIANPVIACFCGSNLRRLHKDDAPRCLRGRQRIHYVAHIRRAISSVPTGLSRSSRAQHAVLVCPLRNRKRGIRCQTIAPNAGELFTSIKINELI